MFRSRCRQLSGKVRQKYINIRFIMYMKINENLVDEVTVTNEIERKNIRYIYLTGAFHWKSAKSKVKNEKRNERQRSAGTS